MCARPEACEALAPPSSRPTSDCLVALTGYGRGEDAARALEAGFDRHLTKPASPDTLLRVVAEVRSGS